MTQGKKRAFWPKGKDWAIIVLAVVALVQGWLLTRSESPPAGPAAQEVAVEDLVLDSPRNKNLLVALSGPLGQDRVGETLPNATAAIDPDIPGDWSFINPYTLRFSSNQTFQPRTRYAIQLNQDILDRDDRRLKQDVLHLETTPFELDAWDVQWRVGAEGGAQVVLAGRLEFNLPVSPEELLKNLALRDPANNATVELAMETSYDTPNPRFVSAPLVKKEAPRTLELALGKELTPADSDIALGKEWSQDIALELDPDLKLQKVKTDSRPGRGDVSLSFSSPVDAAAARDALAVSPQVDFSVASSGQTVTLSGEFAPRKTYTVVVEQGLAAEDGALLRHKAERKVSMPDVPPRLGFRSQGMFLARDAAAALALETVNIQRVELAVDRVYRNNLFLLFQNYAYNVFDNNFSGGIAHVLGDQVESRNLKIQGEPNEETTTIVDFSKAMRQGGPGLYKVSAKMPDTWDGDERWVLATDIGLAAKQGENQLLVWAASFDTARPLREVKVSLLSDQNQVVGHGTTDAKGLCRIKLPETDPQGRPFMLLAEKGRDLSFLLLDHFQDDMAGLPVGGQEISRKGYSAFMYGERDIYRPGESVQAAAIVRGGDLKAPPPAPMVLEHRDPQGRLLSRRTVTPDLRGMAAFDLDLPAYALTGAHSLELVMAGETIGQYRFQVEDFVPDRIKVRIDPGKTHVLAGGPLPFTVEGDYLFGAPAADLGVTARVRLVPEAFAPPGYQNYVFEGPQSFEARKLAEHEGRLDAKGLSDFSVEIPEGLKPPSAMRVELAATVLETGGRGVSAMKPVSAHAYPRYVGLKKLDKQGFQPGEAVELAFAVLAPDGEPAAPKKLTAELYEDRWRTVMRRTASGSFRYESVRDSRLVESKDVPAADNGAFRFSAPDVGAYRVVLRDAEGGAATQVSFFVGGYGYSPWALSNPARLEVAPDKTEYKAGDVA
ncbi:MAG: MG2 domain-containing protein, partial [Desulfovibrionaceae bacterium]